MAHTFASCALTNCANSLDQSELIYSTPSNVMSERGWMGDTSGGDWGPDDGADYEDEPSCPHCGYQMDWAECHMIDCEDGQYDLGEEDCINYDRGTYATCQECQGHGGNWYCPNKDCKPPSNTSNEQSK